VLLPGFLAFTASSKLPVIFHHGTDIDRDQPLRVIAAPSTSLRNNLAAAPKLPFRVRLSGTGRKN
jgi:hypothetical protein